MKRSSRSLPLSGIFRRPDSGPIGRLSTARWSVLLIALVISAIGVGTVGSASSELGAGYFSRQLLWVGLGLVVSIVVLALDYQRLASLALPIYGFGIFLLVIVLIPGLGRVRGGARSWLGLGSFQVQPSEIAKLTTVLLLARFLAGIAGDRLRTREILVTVAIVALPMGLIVLQSDLGSAAMFVPMLSGMIWVAGVRWRFVVAACLLGLCIGGAVWTFGLQDYQRDRVLTFLSPESDPHGAGYQARQSKIAVGSGALLGRGYEQGTQSQLRFLPARHTDFIFAVLAEEWGFLGVLVVLGLYGTFFFNVIEVATRARDRLGILLVVGVLATLAFHVLYNTAMVIGRAPITGIPLPFLSYGGSFTLLCFAACGLILNVDYRRYVNR
jgi:rod shape determining protein RodA